MAFPSISTGVYGFPMQRAATIALTEIKRFIKKERNLEKVMMVCFGQAAYTIHRQAYNTVFKKSETAHNE